MKRNRAMAYESPKAHANIRRIHELLSAKPMHAGEIAKALGLSVKSAYLYLHHLGGQCHVSGRLAALGGAKLFSWGSRPGAKNVPPVLREPPAVKRKRVVRVPDAMPPERQERLERFRRQNYYKPQPVRRDVSVAAMFGPASLAQETYRQAGC